MKATEAKMLSFLKKSPQFIIPIYQRTYSWTEPECQQIWDDVLRAGTDNAISAHFVGSIVYIEKGLYQVTSQSPLLVIDGQQRLTTISLLIEALARELGDNEPIDGFSSKKLRSYYLLNTLEEDERRYKLLLTQTDKQTFLSILDQKSLPNVHSIRINENFKYFEKKLKSLSGELGAICTGLAKLMIVDIALSRDQDNPQLIFESMNSTGRELSQADLIRNYILMGLDPGQQTRLYQEHWRPMEMAFGQEAYGLHFDNFMRHYLTVKTDVIPNIRDVYKAFKEHSQDKLVAERGVDALIAEVHVFADYYSCMALGKETHPVLADVFKDLRELKVEVAFPLLLELYHDYRVGLLSAEDLALAVRFVESYVFRRSVCSIPTNSMNKTFANFGRTLDKEHYLESIKAQFLLLPSYRRFPRNGEFNRELRLRDLYNFRNRSYWLRRLENFNRKERVLVDEYTIEHILPQNPKLSQEWCKELGNEWKQIQDNWLHTIGNLTLTAYNSEYSDRPFAEKRDMKGGFKESPLRLNEGLGQIEAWNESELKQRAEKLANMAVEVWVQPSLPENLLDFYRPKESEKPAAYSIEQHPYLIYGSEMYGDLVVRLFEEFRKQVVALNPCVTEEFLKLYVAYKAETNFVDVIPQAKRLLLSLNMRFHELSDPRGIAQDVTNKGRWGNGDIEVSLNNIEDITYILGLVRQAFEKQMGNGNNQE